MEFDLFAAAGMELESDRKKREEKEQQKKSFYGVTKKSVLGSIETIENADENEVINQAKGLIEEADNLADLEYLSEEERKQGLGIENLDKAKAKLDEATRLVNQEIAKTKPKSSSNSSKPKPASEKFKINMDTRIIYRPDEFMIGELFTSEEIEKGFAKEKDGKIEFTPIDETHLKAKLEERYAELIPSFTHLVWMKAKNMIGVVLQGQKKGICTEEESYEIPSLLSPVLPIPFSLLEDFVAIANYFHQTLAVEVHGDIYFDYDKQNFFLDIPGQKVSHVFAEKTESADETFMRLWDKNAKKVMEIHSHHKFAPIPSPTDNQSERCPGLLYAIVGKLHQKPTFTCRTFDKQLGHVPLNPLEIFESIEGFDFHKSIDRYDLSVVEVNYYE